MVVVYSPTRSFRQLVRNRSSPKVVNKQEVCKKRRCVVTNIRAVETTTSCGKTTNYDNKRAANKYKLAAKKKQRSVTTKYTTCENNDLWQKQFCDKNNNLWQKTFCDKKQFCFKKQQSVTKNVLLQKTTFCYKKTVLLKKNNNLWLKNVRWQK